MRRAAWMCALVGGLVLTHGAGTASAASQVQLGVSPSLSQLVIVGEADDDNIVVSESAGTITITDAGTGGITTVAPCTSVSATTVTCPTNPTGGGPLFVFFTILLGGDDTFSNQNLDVPISQVNGEAGNDVLETGPGDDFVSGGDGNDRVLTGAGDDQLAWDPGTDEMNGGPGDDEAEFGNAFTGIQASFDGLANDGPVGEKDNLVAVEAAFGTIFGDVMRGDDNANRFDGDQGNDVIVGRGGSDDLIGDDGNDQLTGGASPDGARDHLDCGSGFDVALIDTHDFAEPSCERRGASIAADQAKLRRRGRVKVRIACPPEEAATCRGTLSLFLNGRRLSRRGKLKVRAGETAKGTIRLKPSGRKKLRRAGGSLFVTVRAKTDEPGGSSVSEARVLLSR